MGLTFYILAYLVAKYVEGKKEDKEQLKMKSYKKTEEEIKDQDIFTISRL